MTTNQNIRQPVVPLINQISRRPTIIPEGSQFQCKYIITREDSIFEFLTFSSAQILSSQNPQQAVSVANQFRASVQQSIPLQFQRPNIQQLQSHQFQPPRIIGQQSQIQQQQVLINY